MCLSMFSVFLYAPVSARGIVPFLLCMLWLQTGLNKTGIIWDNTDFPSHVYLLLFSLFVISFFGEFWGRKQSYNDVMDSKQIIKALKGNGIFKVFFFFSG